jgi:hypothetical protein
MDKKSFRHTISGWPEPLATPIATGEVDLSCVLDGDHTATSCGCGRARDVRLEDLLYAASSEDSKRWAAISPLRLPPSSRKTSEWLANNPLQ